MDAPTGPEGGSFEQISFSLLLIRALDKRWSGSLAVQPSEGEPHVVQLDRGLVSRVLVPDGFARLGDIVVEAGVVMQPELEQALEGGGLLGQALAKARLIDAKTLQRALVLQLLKRLVRLFAIDTNARFVFRPGDTSPFEGMPEGVRIDTLRVLWAGLSAHGESGGWQRSTLRRIGESPFRIRADVNLRRFGFTGEARNVVRRIRDEQWSLSELAERCGDDEVVGRIVYLLAITRHLDFAPAGDSETLNGFQIEDESSTQDPISDDPFRVAEPSERPAPPRESELGDTEEGAAQGKGRQVARIKLRRRVARRGGAAEPPSSREAYPSSERSTDRGSERPSHQAEGADQTMRSISSRDQLSAEVKSRLARLDRETPYSLLDLEVGALDGLTEDEAVAVAWEALERLSRRWDPDNCPVDSHELEEGMAKVHGAMRRAFEILCDPQQRLLARSMAAAQQPVPRDINRPVKFATSRSAPTPRAKGSSPERDPSDREPSSGRPTGSDRVPSSDRPFGSDRVPSSDRPFSSDRVPSSDRPFGSERLPSPGSDRRPGSDREPRSNWNAPSTRSERASHQAPASPSSEDVASGQRTAHATPAEFHERALMAFAEQDYEEALRLARQASSLAPSIPDYLAMAAWAHAHTDDPDLELILFDFDDILERFPDHVTARFYRGSLLRRVGRHEAARSDFRRVLEVDPDHGGARRHLSKMGDPSTQAG